MPVRLDDTKFRLGAGTVQAYVARITPFFMHHFGRAEYDREKPVISHSIREQAEPIIRRLNEDSITIDEAVEALNRIRF